MAKGALRGEAPAWEIEAKAGIAWTVAQVIEIRNEQRRQTALLGVIARCLGWKGQLRG